MTKLTSDDMQCIAAEVRGLALGVDQLYLGGLKEGRQAIPPMLNAIATKADALSTALDFINEPFKQDATTKAPGLIDMGDVLDQVIKMKGLIESAFEMDNAGRGEEVTSLLTVLRGMAHQLNDTLDPPRSMAAE